MVGEEGVRIGHDTGIEVGQRPWCTAPPEELGIAKCLLSIHVRASQTSV